MGNKTEFRTALVTGGAKRIGAAIATDLAEQGFSVAIHCHHSREEAESLADNIRLDGGKAVTVQGDLTDEGACRKLLADARDAIGPVDLLVNNASLFEPDSGDNPDMELWDRHFAIHLKAPVLLTGELARQHELENGLAVNLIDQRVWALTPHFFSYTLSKSALWTATQTLAQSLAPKIRVNGIGPGPTLPNERQTSADLDRQVSALLLERGPSLADFGRTIRYLYETDSITGQMIALDGGQHLAWETPDVTGMRE